MQKQLEEKLTELIHLSQTAQNKKILPEECVMVTNQAFQLENEILTLIEAEEATETDIKSIQMLYDLRENVWDIVGKITAREEEVKAKAHIKETYRENKEAFRTEQEHCCHHHHAGCCCGEEKSHAHQPCHCKRAQKNTKIKK